MRNKQIYIGLLLFLLVISMNFVKAQNSLIIKFNDGSQTGSLLSTIDRITFSGGNLLLKNTDATSSSLIISDIDKLSFGVLSGVPEVFTDETSLMVYPSPATDYIVLKNPPAGEINIIVFRLDGSVLMNKKLSNASQKINISNFANGLYLLKVNNKTLKFTKQ